MTEDIKSIILTAIPDATVYVANPGNDGEHFESIVISPTFDGLSRVKQQQMVMRSLKQAFAESVGPAPGASMERAGGCGHCSGSCPGFRRAARCGNEDGGGSAGRHVRIGRFSGRACLRVP